MKKHLALLLLILAVHSARAGITFTAAQQQYVDIPNFEDLGIAGEVTVEFWAKTTAAAAQSAFMLDPDNASNRFQAHLNYFNGNTYWDFGDIGAAGAGSGRLQTPNVAAWLGNWTHFALVASQSGQYMKLFANGVLIKTSPNANDFDSVASALRIGGSTGFFYTGSLDDFRIWNMARSESAIRRDMHRRLSGSEPGLRLYHKLDHSSGASSSNAASATGSAFNGTLNGTTPPVWGESAVTVYTVTNASDSGAGSLRAVLAQATADAGIARVVFGSSLAGQTITLNSGQLDLTDSSTLEIDGSTAPGLTLSGGGLYRILHFSGSGRLVLRQLTLSGGFGVRNAGLTGSGNDTGGGAIRSLGDLDVFDCTFTGNSAITGGALSLADFGADALIEGCTFHNNTSRTDIPSAGVGAILSFGKLTVRNSTFHANHNTNTQTDYAAAAVSCNNSSANLLEHCTFTDNTCVTKTARAAVAVGAGTTIRNCLFSGNEGADVYNHGSTDAVILTGANLIPSVAGSLYTGATPLTGTPSLGPLGNYGGPTQTRPLLPTSPVGIDAGIAPAVADATLGTDQRGSPRVLNGNGTTAPDLGAVESVLHPSALIVTNTHDSGAGSLRWALANAADFVSGMVDTITFAPAISGQTITLGSEIVINDAGGVTVDANPLSGGVTIDGGTDDNRIFTVSSGDSVTLKNLTFTGGGGKGPGGDVGGAIYNLGKLTLTRCSFSGNSSRLSGGAIYNGGTLALTQCSFANSDASLGGAIFNFIGTLTLTHCSLSGNSASDGGAIYNLGKLTLTHCSLSGNSVRDNGGGIYSRGRLTLTNSIIAGNTLAWDGSDEDIYNTTAGATVTRIGANIVQTIVNDSGAADSGPAAITAAPLLAPLASNGGPTQTMALLPGSPAIDAVPPSAIIAGLDTDQRGLPRSRDGDATTGAAPDIGAYEAQVAPVGSLGFNFNGANPRNLLPTESAGAPGFAQTHWNNLRNVSGYGDAATPSLIAGGDSVPIRLWYDSLGVWQFGTTTTPDEKLMGGHLYGPGSSNENTGGDLNDSNNQPYFALADLPSALTLGGYRVVVYADTDATDGRVAEYWLTTHADLTDVTGTRDISPHLFLADSANFSGTYTRVPATSTKRETAAEGNYLVFENQTQPAFILRTEDYPASHAVISGVQVVRNELLVVTTAEDENDPVGTAGAGLSLREAVALAPDGEGIVFDSALSGQTITLNAALGEILLSRGVTIDAGNLPAGVTIAGGSGDNRLFVVNSAASVVLNRLTLTGGFGGAIDNHGALTLAKCTLHGNSAQFGGAIHNLRGTLTLTQCTLSGNSAIDGGAIYNVGTLTLTQCTLSGNSTIFNGGAIYCDGGSAWLANCIVAGNTVSLRGNGPDIYKSSGALTPNGVNLIGDLADSSLTAGPAVLVGAPLLAPLGNYGGPTRTLALRPGSPARNAAAVLVPAISSDQRGFPIIGTPDIGAYEAGTFSNYPAYIWESLPTAGNGTNTDPLHASTHDFDGDGATNGEEWEAETDAGAFSSALRFVSMETSGGALSAVFPTVAGRTYRLQSTDDLTPPQTWTDTGDVREGDGNPQTFSPLPSGRAYRVTVDPR